jgi:hypothetical protein
LVYWPSYYTKIRPAVTGLAIIGIYDCNSTGGPDNALNHADMENWFRNWFLNRSETQNNKQADSGEKCYVFSCTHGAHGAM